MYITKISPSANSGIGGELASFDMVGQGPGGFF